MALHVGQNNGTLAEAGQESVLAVADSPVTDSLGAATTTEVEEDKAESN